MKPGPSDCWTAGCLGCVECIPEWMAAVARVEKLEAAIREHIQADECGTNALREALEKP